MDSIHFADSKRGGEQQDGAPSASGAGDGFVELDDDRDLPF